MGLCYWSASVVSMILYTPAVQMRHYVASCFIAPVVLVWWWPVKLGWYIQYMYGDL